MPGAGTGAITMSATLLFHCATCAFQTGPASQKTVSPSPPPFSNDMQTMSQAPRQLLPVRRGGVKAQTRQELKSIEGSPVEPLNHFRFYMSIMSKT